MPFNRLAFTMHSNSTVIVIHNAGVQAFSSGVVATPLIYETVCMHAYPADSSDSAAEATGVATSTPLLLQHRSLRGLQILASQGPESDFQVLQHSGSQLFISRFKSLSVQLQGGISRVSSTWCTPLASTSAVKIYQPRLPQVQLVMSSCQVASNEAMKPKGGGLSQGK